jgi:hypothetical protein
MHPIHTNVPTHCHHAIDHETIHRAELRMLRRQSGPLARARTRRDPSTCRTPATTGVGHAP